MNRFHETLTPEMKKLFQNKLSKDQITATAFIKFYIYELNNDKIDSKTFDEIREYQAQNPGSVTELTDYIMINLTEEEHQSLFMKKLTTKINPQHYLRFFIEKYCKEGLPEKIISKIREFILKRGPKGKRKI